MTVSQDHAPHIGSVTSGQSHTPLVDLELVCGDLFDRWDKDMRSGKLLTALTGLMAPGYDPRVDRIRAALSAHSELLEALKALQLQALQSPDLTRTEWGCEALDAARAAISKATGEQL